MSDPRVTKDVNLGSSGVENGGGGDATDNRDANVGIETYLSSLESYDLQQHRFTGQVLSEILTDGDLVRILEGTQDVNQLQSENGHPLEGNFGAGEEANDVIGAQQPVEGDYVDRRELPISIEENSQSGESEEVATPTTSQAFDSTLINEMIQSTIETAIMQMQPPPHCTFYQNLPECIRCPPYQICNLRENDYCRSCHLVASSVAYYLSTGAHDNNFLSYYGQPRLANPVHHDIRLPPTPEPQTEENVNNPQNEQNATYDEPQESNSMGVKRKNYSSEKKNKVNENASTSSYSKQGAVPKPKKKRIIKQESSTTDDEYIEKKKDKKKRKPKQPKKKENVSKNKKNDPLCLGPTRVTIPSQTCIQLRKRINEEPLYKVYFGHVIINVYSNEELKDIPRYYQEYFDNLVSSEEDSNKENVKKNNKKGAK